MRDGDILSLAETWKQIFDGFDDSDDFNKNCKIAATVNVVSRCLKVLARYVSWVDIQIIA